MNECVRSCPASCTREGANCANSPCSIHRKPRRCAKQGIVRPLALIRRDPETGVVFLLGLCLAFRLGLGFALRRWLCLGLRLCLRLRTRLCFWLGFCLALRRDLGLAFRLCFALCTCGGWLLRRGCLRFFACFLF